MFRSSLAFILIAFGLVSYAQNDLDAIRYSRIGGGGSARFTAMGGAFGAVGADLSSGSYNPAGLGVYRKGDVSFGFGFHTTNNTGTIYNKNTSVFDLNVIFNNFGIAGAWNSKSDPDSRHAFAFTNNQLQNFNNSTRMSGYTNNSSIAKDMYVLAERYKSSGPDITGNLLNSYEGLGFDTYVLDTADGKFFSFVDLKRTVKQTRDIVTSGRVNDNNLSYAYSYKDKFYLGGSLGLLRVKYESTVTHTESDDRDSTRIVQTSNNSFTDTYVDPLPDLYPGYENRLGFRSLEYTEYFKTTGSGLNLKLGGIARVNDLLRLGLYVHTPTIYYLQDSYYNQMTAYYDRSPSTPFTSKSPANGGTYDYRIITPGRLGLNAAFIIQKIAVVAIDYEMIGYNKARLSSADINSFEDVNTLIGQKYKAGHNLRIGGELNFNPIMVRAGYNMQGSPFGDVFTGDFVRNTFSVGFGFRTKNNFYGDFVLYKTVSTENYYLYTALNTQAKLNYNSTTLSATFGFKF